MRQIQPILMLIYSVSLVPPGQELREKRLFVDIGRELIELYSQKTDTEQQLDLAKLHDKVEDSHLGTRYG